ncbi:MAG: glycosyltransferase family 39 protein [Planctomycetota bacterium]
MGAAFIRSAAPTFDEPPHIAGGYSTLTTGSYRFHALHHPPFAEIWPAIPLVFLGADNFSSHPTWTGWKIYGYAEQFLYHNRLSAERMLNAGRIFNLLAWYSLLVLGLWNWSRRLGGGAAALGAATVAAFCPVVISNLALVTTDTASSVCFFTTFWLLSIPDSGRRKEDLLRTALAGAAAGLAVASKFNMIILPPLALGLLIADWLFRKKPSADFP